MTLMYRRTSIIAIANIILLDLIKILTLAAVMFEVKIRTLTDVILEVSDRGSSALSISCHITVTERITLYLITRPNSP